MERLSRLETAEERRRGAQLDLRCCEEVRQLDPWAPSGVYRVDPDGAGSGLPAILVHCDMATGATLVSHDQEGGH